MPQREATLTFRNTIAVAVLVALSGCAACDSVPSSALEKCQQAQVFGGPIKTDILFVIDDSGSMSEEQDKLRIALSRFINTLNASPISDQYRIGVTNTSVHGFQVADADYSSYTSGPSNGLPYPAGALVSVDPASPFDVTNPGTWGKYFWTASASAPGPGFYGPRNLTYQYMTAGDANLVSDFEHDVLVGTFGSGREQPFEAMKRALSTQLQTGGENVGFLRSGARLAIIFLSDEDDCSGLTDPNVTSSADCAAQRTANPSTLTPVSDYVSFLNGQIGSEQREVVLGAVVGVTCAGGICTNTKCPTAYTDPPANRFLELLSAFPHSMVASICDASFDSALDQFANAVMGQTMPLSGEVADPHLLVVTVTKTTGVVSCSVAQAGTADAATADAVYTPPQSGGPTLTFQRNCALAPGDQIDIHVICAG